VNVAITGLLSDPHARTVLATTATLGASCGLAGTLLVLRRRALLGDAAGHATLPGIVGAGAVSLALGGTGREPWVLVAGAVLGAVAGIAAVHWIRRATRLPADAAMAIALGSLFGLGTAMLSALQQVEGGHGAGLESLVTGDAATLVRADLHAAVAVAAACAVLAVVLRDDLRALAFDEDFARSVGRPVGWLDALVSAMAIANIVAGMRAVGLVLSVALLVIPAAAARPWCRTMGGMMAIGALLGALGAVAGTIASAAISDAPTGPFIVLACGGLLAASLAIAPRVRGARTEATA
jgi:manganese/zinc/iron transport system permease protein